MIPSASSRQRLVALGIGVWLRRDRRVAAQPAADYARARESVQGSHDGVARMRMASGDGNWLLVQEAPWDGRHDALLGDIQATIGSARCRFGQWAHSDSAGVSVAELDSRGVSHVLVFGQAPAGAGEHSLIRAPALTELAASAEARKQLWQLLASALGD